MNVWAITFGIWTFCFALSLHLEVTQGHSIAGCFLRGLYHIETNACSGDTP